MESMSSMRSASPSTSASMSRRSTCPWFIRVKQPARSGDNNVDAAPQSIDLGVLIDAAAEDHRLPQRKVAAIGTKTVGDL